MTARSPRGTGPCTPDWPPDTSQREGRVDIARQAQLLDAALSNVQDYIYVWDRKTRVVYANRATEMLWGVAPEQYLGKPLAELPYSPELVAHLARQTERVFTTQQAVNGEVAYTSPTGAFGYYDYILSPLFGADGQVELLIGVSRNTTERRRLEEALRRANEALEEKVQERTDHLHAREEELRRTHALIEGITAGTDELIAAVDSRFRYLYFNEAYRKEFKKLWGRHLEVGTSVVEALAPWPEQQRNAVTLWRRALKGESFSVTMAFGPTMAQQLTYDLRFNPVRDAQGRIIGAAHIFRDVTQQTRFQEALRESEARFRMLADNMSQLAWMTDETGWIVWYNKRWFDYTGTTLEEMQGGGWRNVHHPDHVDRVLEKIRRCFASGTVWEDTFPLRGRDGEYRWFLSRAVPIRDASGKIVRWFGTNTDITAQREAEERLRESDRRKDEFLAMLGHELRNPLSAVRSATELVKLTHANDPMLRRASGVLERQTTHMARLVDGLLEVSRIARGKIDLDLRTLDVREVLERVLQDRGDQIAARGLDIQPRFPDAPVWVCADSVRLTQVFDNILGNALKFTEAPGCITLAVEEEAGCALVRIRDTGAGIRPAMLARIFEPFQQEAQDIARAAGGLGLGLALAKALVELHRGTIDARSGGPGMGSEFQVRIPLSAAPPAARPIETARAIPPLRILIVEDNLDAADTLRDLLELQGHWVTAVPLGHQGLAHLRQHGADVVLCDIGLPDMSGYAVAQRVRAHASLGAVTLVALTGYGQPEDQKRSQAAGFDAHLTKPVDLAALDQILWELSRPAHDAEP